MPLDLDRLEQRIVGALIEKQLTVPDTYPLTLNALVTACNQKSNRDPHMDVEPYEVEGALRSLMDKGWVRELDKAGGRTLRYEHLAGSQLGVETVDLALLAELLLRGPQTPGELKTRASRMKSLGSPAEVEARLGALADRPTPYVERLERRPREHAARWAHRLGGPGERASAPARESTPREPPPEGAAEPPRARPEAATVADEWQDRVRELEERLANLEDRLDRLEGR